MYANLPPIKLTESWSKVVRTWYPDFQNCVYHVPPYTFNYPVYHSFEKSKKSKKKATEFDGMAVSEVMGRYGIRMQRPTQASQIKDNVAQWQILRSLSAFLERKKEDGKGKAAFIISNMQYQNYLDINFEWKGKSPDEKPTKPKKNIPEGDFDILVLDKQHGIFAIELKAVGKIYKTSDMEAEGLPLKNVKPKIQHGGEQLEKAENCIRSWISDLDPENKIKVRKGLALPNLYRNKFEELLNVYDGLKSDRKGTLKDLRGQLGGVKDIKQILNITLCVDDLPENTAMCLSEEVFSKIDKVWTALLAVEGASEPMSEDLYEKLVARFCGPLTSVSIYTENYCPRMAVNFVKKNRQATLMMQPRDKAHTATLMSRKFSELVMLPDQMRILQEGRDFVHLEGPPGTGKTLLLLLRILAWLDNWCMVWIVSLAPPSRSVTHVLLDQVQNMIENSSMSIPEQKERLARVRMFMVIRPRYSQDEKYFERRLLKFRYRAMKSHKENLLYNFHRGTSDRDCKVCLVVDESGMGGAGSKSFFEQVAIMHKDNTFNNEEFNAGLAVWSASVERLGRPVYVSETPDEEKFGKIYELKKCLRCPPTVQRAMMLVQPSLDKNICCFTEEHIVSNPLTENNPPTKDAEMSPADGLPVFLIAHGSHKCPDQDIWYCYECGKSLAEYLKNTLRIGQEECVCEDKALDEILEENCPDCRKLTKGSLPLGGFTLKHSDVMIVATQQAFQFSVPIGQFSLAMAKNGLKMAMNTTREEGSAALPPDDVILVVDMTSVHGLERAVIIVIPEVVKPKRLPIRYRGILNDYNLPEEETRETEGDEHSHKSHDSEELASLQETNENYPFFGSTDKDEITAAFESLSMQSRRDIYYIATRAVCQFILVHRGKGLSNLRRKQPQ